MSQHMQERGQICHQKSTSTNPVDFIPADNFSHAFRGQLCMLNLYGGTLDRSFYLKNIR